MMGGASSTSGIAAWRKASTGVFCFGFPVCRQKAVDVGDFHPRQSRQYVCEILQGIDAPAAKAYEDRIDNRTAPAGIGVSYEEPSAATHGSWPYRVFDEIVVDFEPSIAQITVSFRQSCMTWFEAI